jgi:hypothetical protein
MKLRLAAAILAVVAIPGLAFGQQHNPPPKGPKPTMADVQRVVQIISSDKAKSQAYCVSKKLYDQMAEAYKKNDSKTADALSKQADAFVSKLGPEYAKVMNGLQQIDPNSSEGKEFISIISGLDKLCTGTALTQPAEAPQSAPAQSGPVQSGPAQSAPAAPRPSAPAQAAPAQAAPAQSAPAQAAPVVPMRPCAQIREACARAGFIFNGANTGHGIVVDCIRPIMAGTPQRQRATRPLPEIDPQVVVACKNRNPNFGMGGGAAAQPGGQSTNPAGSMESPDR